MSYPCIPLIGHKRSVRAVSSSAEGSVIVTGSEDATIRFWHPATGKEIGKINVNSGIGTLAMSADGSKVSIGCENNLIEVWEIKSQHRILQMAGHKSYPCSSMDYSKDGKWVISTGWIEPGAFLWDLEVGKLKTMIVCEDASCVAFSPDSTKLVISGSQLVGGSKVYDVTSGNLITRIKGHSERCTAIRFLDNDTIASVGRELYVQSLSKQSILRQVSFRREFNASNVRAANISDNGQHIAIGEDDLVTEWDIETTKIVLEETRAHVGEQIMAIMYVPRTYTWVSCGARGGVNLWNPAVST